jgi:hypothetical protein
VARRADLGFRASPQVNGVEKNLVPAGGAIS